LPYRVEISRSAERNLDALPSKLVERVTHRILQLGDDPRPPGVTKLSGTAAPLWRIRVGGIRVIYSVSDRDQLVLIERIAWRDQRTYEGL
jgi:mRNA interferase RelE/StbE